MINYLALLGLLTTGAHYERQFIGYNIKRGRDDSMYRKLYPLEIPKNVPSINTIARRLFKIVDPDEFYFGASTSEHQSSKKCTPALCSWSRYAQEHGFTQPTESRYKMDWWNYGENYVDDAKEAIPGFNALRFSIEMALLTPSGPDSWDQSVADHYTQRFLYVLKKGIAPVVCFHHYTDPNWFLDAGGFENEELIDQFVNPCIKLYEQIMKAVNEDEQAMKELKKMAPRTPLWVTFNGPESFALRSYFAEAGPPNKKGFSLVANVLKNELEAHVRIYYRMKELYKSLQSEGVLKEGIPEPQIGLIKNIHQYDPATFTSNQRRLKPLNNFVFGFADQIHHNALYNFFINGVFWVQIPLGVVSKVMKIVDKAGKMMKRNISIADKVAEIAVDLRYVNKKAIGALDFIGLSYYSNRYQFFSKTVPITDERLRTDGDTYYHYPNGMYRAILEIYERFIKPFERAADKKLPLLVAENGIATKDDAKRKRFYHEYLYAMMRATEDGYPVYGYLPWTLMDNYEWPGLDSTDRRYGIFAVTDDGKHLNLKPGSQPLRVFGNALKKRGG